MGFKNRGNKGGTTHRWEIAKGEQKCLRCNLIRRIQFGIELTKSDFKRTTPYEYSQDRVHWISEIPKCEHSTIWAFHYDGVNNLGVHTAIITEGTPGIIICNVFGNGERSAMLRAKKIVTAINALNNENVY